MVLGSALLIVGGNAMEILWKTRKIVITPEEVVERINKCLEQWAAEEKAETEQKDKEECE
jgi:hypothetical protein